MNEDAAYQSTIEKIKADLCNESVNVRRNCLNEFHKCINSSVFELKPADRIDIFKSLIKGFADRIESCREATVNTITQCVNEWDLAEDDVLFHLLPATHKRLLTDKVIESSEEVRLCYFKLMKVIVHKFYKVIGPHLQEIIEILINGICDPYPEIKTNACECASELAEKVREFRLHSDEIIKVSTKLLKHKHSKIRMTVINTLKNLVRFGRPGSIELVYGPLGECLLDQNSNVRLCVLRSASSWFLELPDRYSYFRYLLPLILTGLADETPENCNESYKLWHEIGLKYLQENEDSLKDKQQFLPRELDNYPSTEKRPNIGCRTLVQNEMMKIVPTLLHELEDWKLDVRCKSSELLKVVVLHAETRIVSLLDNLIPVMCKACIDEEQMVSKNVIQAAEIMGYFITTDMFWPLVVSRMMENRTLGQYIILSSLLKFNKKDLIAEKVNQLVYDLAETEICETKDGPTQNCLLKMTSKLLDCSEGTNLNDDVVYNFYLSLITQMAFGSRDIQKETERQIEKLWKLSSCSCLFQLNRKCFPKLFSRLNATSELWESYSTDFNIFIILLSKYPDDVFELAPGETLALLQRIFENKTDRELNFKALSSLVKLFDSENFLCQKNIDFMEKILLGPLKIHLIWQAGKVIEIVRCTAIGLVLLYLQNADRVSTEFISQIFPLLLSSCEDSYEDTRLYSLQTLTYIGKNENGEIDPDIFIKSFCVAANRLNDKSNEVRMKTSKTLKELMLAAPNLNGFKNEIDVENISKGLTLILLNADDHDKQIQSSILDIVNNTSIANNIKSVMTENKLNTLIKKYHNKDVSEMLKKYLTL